MMNYKCKYYFSKLLDKLSFNKLNFVNRTFKKNEISIGKNTRIYSNILSSEGYLISIGSNTTISTDVKLLTHDASIGKAMKNKTDLFGRIQIGSNCFIGANSIILCGVQICDNVIIGAGSVVTKSIYISGIYAGNPAKKICEILDFKAKYSDKAININEYKDIKSVILQQDLLIKK